MLRGHNLAAVLQFWEGKPGLRDAEIPPSAGPAFGRGFSPMTPTGPFQLNQSVLSLLFPTRILSAYKLGKLRYTLKHVGWSIISFFLFKPKPKSSASEEKPAELALQPGPLRDAQGDDALTPREAGTEMEAVSSLELIPPTPSC